MVIINAYECYKITETRNRTPLPSFNCMCAAHAVNIVQVVSLPNRKVTASILFGTAVILGKKATQNMQMLVYTNFIELSYDQQMTSTQWMSQLAVCTRKDFLRL